MLINKLREDLKEAIKSKNEVKKTVVRGMIAECDAFIKEAKRDMTADEDLGVIRKLVKQANETIEGAKSAGREDLIAEAEAELEILNTYLPKQLSEEEVREIVRCKILDGNLDCSNKGLLMKNLMPLFASQTDRGMINRVISSFVTK